MELNAELCMDRHGFRLFRVRIVLGMGWDKGDEGYGWVWASGRVKDWGRVRQVIGLGLGV